jgi:hypothetical protein
VRGQLLPAGGELAHCAVLAADAALEADPQLARPQVASFFEWRMQQLTRTGSINPTESLKTARKALLRLAAVQRGLPERTLSPSAAQLVKVLVKESKVHSKHARQRCYYLGYLGRCRCPAARRAARPR